MSMMTSRTVSIVLWVAIVLSRLLVDVVLEVNLVGAEVVIMSVDLFVAFGGVVLARVLRMMMSCCS